MVCYKINSKKVMPPLNLNLKDGADLASLQ